MKKRKTLYAVLILLIVFLSLIVINNIKICSVYPQDAEFVYKTLQDKYKSEDVDICILDYDYVTGAGWGVDASTNKNLENTYVVLDTLCNPRLLKINQEFDLDYLAKFVVVIDKTPKQTTVDSETVYLIKAKEIVITNFYTENDGVKEMKFGDLTFAGKCKAIAALFVPKFRLQL